MAVDEKKKQAAEQIFNRMVSHYESKGIKKYDTKEFEEDCMYRMSFSYTGEDLPMEFVILVDGKRSLIRLFSRQPITVKPEQVPMMAQAVCAVNEILVNGFFSLEAEKGIIRWQVTVPYMESLISEEVFDYLILISIHTVDDYNDKFLLLQKGMVSLEAFIKDVRS